MWNVQAPRAIDLDIAWLVITFVFVALRVYVQAYRLRNFGLPDALIILAWFCFLGDAVNDYFTYKYGFWDKRLKYSVGGALPDYNNIVTDHDELRKAFILMYAIQPLYFVELNSIKFAFLLLYLQLFPPDMIHLRRALYFTFGLVALGSISIILLSLLWCTPVSRNWTMNPEERCLSWAVIPIYFYSTGLNIVSDILVYALPFFLIPRLYSAASSLGRLVGIALMFSLGLLCIVCTVCRIALAGVNADAATIAIWFSAEQAVAIIVVCCPPLRFLPWSKAAGTRRNSPPATWRVKKGTRGRVVVTEFGTIIPATQACSDDTTGYPGTIIEEGNMFDVEERGLAPRTSVRAGNEVDDVVGYYMRAEPTPEPKRSVGLGWIRLKSKIGSSPSPSNSTFGGTLRSAATFGGRNKPRTQARNATESSKNEVEQYKIEFGLASLGDASDDTAPRPPSLAMGSSRKSGSAVFGLSTIENNSRRESRMTLASSFSEEPRQTERRKSRVSVGSMTFGRKSWK